MTEKPQWHGITCSIQRPLCSRGLMWVRHVAHKVKHIGKRKRVASSFQRKQDVKKDKDVSTDSNNTHTCLSFSQVTARETDTELALDPAWEPSSPPYNTQTLLPV